MDTLTNQEFLYRETPVNYDGTGTLTSIKGNTVSFNQLIQNGNFADISNWNRSSLASYSASNNIYSWTGNAQYNGIYQILNWISGHKYYFTIDVYGTNTSNRYRLQVNGSDKEVYGNYINGWETVKGIYDCSVSRSGNFFICDLTSSSWTEIKARCAMVFDLTLMGIDNLTTTAEVEAWLSSHVGDLPYYDYTQGTLIPFTGTGLLTGLNSKQNFDYTHYDELEYIEATGNQYINTNVIPSNKKISAIVDGALLNGLANSVIIGSTQNDGVDNFQIGALGNLWRIKLNNYGYQDNNADYNRHIFRLNTNQGTSIDDIVCTTTQYTIASSNTRFISLFARNFGGTIEYCYSRVYSCKMYDGSLLIRDFVPAKRKSDNVLGLYDTVNQVFYTNQGTGTFNAGDVVSYNVLSLPILTYFPTGMKSAGSVYDELTPSKVITRVGSVDLGTLDWTYESSINSMISSVSGIKSPTRDDTAFNGELAIARIIPASQRATTTGVRAYIFENDNILYIRGTNYTDANAFKQAMSGQYLYYELATPTETDISLDLTYPVWNSGTEQILPINDSTPDTAPILCDIDYRGLIPVNATVDPSGSGTVSGTGNYRYHSIATLEATPSDEIYRFLRWEDENGDTVSTNSVFSFEVGE